jgi:hypothetical protein
MIVRRLLRRATLIHRMRTVQDLWVERGVHDWSLFPSGFMQQFRVQRKHQVLTDLIYRAGGTERLLSSSPFAPASSNLAEVYWNRGSISNSRSYLFVSRLARFFSSVASPPVLTILRFLICSCSSSLPWTYSYSSSTSNRFGCVQLVVVRWIPPSTL